ncbi:hypothetical protein HYV81_01485 [Candidatus Woesearchaeota archaeon]|nr:hypothetical protein [Candidatus Woesearchaeota archaeon]
MATIRKTLAKKGLKEKARALEKSFGGRTKSKFLKALPRAKPSEKGDVSTAIRKVKQKAGFSMQVDVSTETRIPGEGIPGEAPGAFEKMQENVGIDEPRTAPAPQGSENQKGYRVETAPAGYKQSPEPYEAKKALEEQTRQKAEAKTSQEKQIDGTGPVKPPMTPMPGLPFHPDTMDHQLAEGQPLKKPAPIPQFDTRFMTRDDKIPHPEEIVKPSEQFVKQGLTLEKQKVHYAPFPTTPEQRAFMPEEMKKQRIDPDAAMQPERQTIQQSPFPLETGPQPKEIGDVIKSEYDKLLKRPQPGK